MSDMRFEEPPRKRTRGVDHSDRAEQLREKPGEWGIVSTEYTSSASAASLARHIRAGFLSSYSPAGSFEAKARTVAGEHRVYARYVGEGNDGNA